MRKNNPWALPQTNVMLSSMNFNRILKWISLIKKLKLKKMEIGPHNQVTWVKVKYNV